MLFGRSSSSISTPFGDDLIVARRGHDELAGRLVVRVIDHRQPVADQVRPVVAEERSLAVHVVADAQARRGRAAIADRKGELLAGFRPRRQHQLQAIVGVREDDVVRRRAGRRRSGRRAAPTAPSCPLPADSDVRSRSSVANRVAQELHRDGGFAGDLVSMHRSAPAGTRSEGRRRPVAGDRCPREASAGSSRRKRNEPPAACVSDYHRRRLCATFPAPLT